VFFGLLAVLLCVLWARSYWWIDQLVYPISTVNCFGLTSVQGQLDLGMSVFPLDGGWIRLDVKDLDNPPMNVSIFSFSASGPGKQKVFPRLQFHRNLDPNLIYEFVLPYWLLVLISGFVCAAPQITWSKRFSLRTLLIATTLVAVGLGLVVWASR
jgi:hypothetical protein